MSSPDKLVHMANQIGKFFASQDQAKAPARLPNIFANSGIRACARRYARISRKAERDSIRCRARPLKVW